MGHLGRLNKCADSYYGQNLLRTGLAMLRRHAEVSQAERRQKGFAEKVYRKKLKNRFIRFLRQSNKEFRGLSRRVEGYMRDRATLLVLHGLSNYAKRRRALLKVTPNPSAYYFALMFLVKRPASFSFEQESLRLRMSETYQRQRQAASRGLAKYVLRQVFEAWKVEHQSLGEFKSHREQRLKSRVVRRLKQKSQMNHRYRYMLNNYL